MIGNVVGRYEILAELGRGANGVVWKARHTLLPDRLVALKVLSENLWSSEQARRRFLQEAIAVSRLDHPCIATLYDAEEIQGQLYIAFKVVDGETVAKRTANGSMPVRSAVAIARDAAEGLAHAHGLGIVHRDISAGNIMVSGEGRGVLVDFGLARGEQSITQTSGMIVGTLPFMPPEVLRGAGADARSDIYGVGAVLYRMLTGRMPFEGSQPEEIVYQILNHRPKPPSAVRAGIPPELDDIVMRALERDPRDRYASAREMARALDDVLAEANGEQESTIIASPKSRGFSSLRRALRRRSARWLIGAAGAALVTLAAVGVAWMKGWRPAFVSHVPVVAVIPARNMSEDAPGVSYIGGAFGEELVARLGQVSKLQLVPWLTTQRFTNPNQTLQEVGRELHADRLVVSTYRSDGERVKVNVTLVDGKSGLQNWSHEYEESAEDLSTLPASIATGLAMQLRGSLTDTERARLGTAASSNPDAFVYYLRGADAMSSEDPNVVALAGQLFERALQLDPNLPLAWVGLGAVKEDAYFRGAGGERDLDVAEQAFLKALQLSPNLYEAYRGLLTVAYERGQYEYVLRIGKSLDAKSDNPEILLSRAWAYTLGMLPEKAIPILERVLQVDPASRAAAWYLIVAEAWAGQRVRSIQHSKAYLSKYSEDAEVYYWLGLNLFVAGDKPGARLCVSRSLELFGEQQSNIYSNILAALIYRQMGERERSDSLATAWLEILDGRLRAHPDNYRIQLYHAALASWTGRLGGEAELDSLVTKAASDRRFSGMSEMLGAFRGSSRLRRALVALRNTDVAPDYIQLNYGAYQIWFGDSLAEVERLPEFQAFVAAIQRRHDELAARY